MSALNIFDIQDYIIQYLDIESLFKFLQIKKAVYSYSLTSRYHFILKKKICQHFYYLNNLDIVNYDYNFIYKNFYLKYKNHKYTLTDFLYEFEHNKTNEIKLFKFLLNKSKNYKELFIVLIDINYSIFFKILYSYLYKKIENHTNLLCILLKQENYKKFIYIYNFLEIKDTQHIFYKLNHNLIIKNIKNEIILSIILHKIKEYNKQNLSKRINLLISSEFLESLVLNKNLDVIYIHLKNLKEHINMRHYIIFIKKYELLLLSNDRIKLLLNKYLIKNKN